MSSQTWLTPEVRQRRIEVLDRILEEVGKLREATETAPKARNGR